MKYLLVLLLLLAVRSNLCALVCKTIEDGNWSDTSSWYNGDMPSSTDSIYINHNIYLDQDIDLFAGAYLRIDSAITLCGFHDLYFECGAHLYNYGTMKIRKMEWSGLVNEGKIHIQDKMIQKGCDTTYYSGTITIGIPFACDGCSIPVFTTTLTNSKEYPTGSIDITMYDPNNENLNFSYSIDGVHYQMDTQFNSLYPGVYSLFVKDDNDCITKKEFEIKLITSTNIQIYPNPFTDKVIVELYNQMDNYVKLFDPLGKLIFKETIFGNQTRQISTFMNLSDGIYMLEIENELESNLYRLIKI